jgi:hypothetical protein
LFFCSFRNLPRTCQTQLYSREIWIKCAKWLKSKSPSMNQEPMHCVVVVLSSGRFHEQGPRRRPWK